MIPKLKEIRNERRMVIKKGEDILREYLMI